MSHPSVTNLGKKTSTSWVEDKLPVADFVAVPLTSVINSTWPQHYSKFSVLRVAPDTGKISRIHDLRDNKDRVLRLTNQGYLTSSGFQTGVIKPVDEKCIGAVSQYVDRIRTLDFSTKILPQKLVIAVCRTATF